ncbi:MAG: rRNA pseudouridine synthase [Campylobacteraceae bacterium]|jgi:23S rRNA pseudouridine2605 synthase|nr:rRNA pseudouridine synthase [Campylobacteraceae bacterium]MBT4571879.1 rRNA pseudouridine synthase [Campylobacteraceae bacterium]MBT5323217.1 rRNA pseudouridine synthase [Campylobacteraceae bacterium]MBT7273599.1 rRNA pseudouridine synthase [Campylobacteraceae bacterium]
MNNSTNNSKNLLALNKPKGYVVTRSDERGRKTVYDLLPDWVFNDQWMPIGRLDLESKGLLLFTTNGKIGNALTKPGNCVKVYEIWVRGHVTNEHIAQAKKGVESKHGLLKALVVEKIGTGGAKTKLKIIINEGKNRHIRRLFGALKDQKFGTPLKVLSLNRVSIGSFKLDIELANWRYLSEEEEKILMKDFN